MSHNFINFRTDERGNVAILFSLMMLPILGGIGVAVDFGRADRLHTQLQIVADAATAAGLGEYRKTGDVNKGQQRLLSFIDQGLEKDGMVRAREENANGKSVIGARVVYVDGSVIDPKTSSVRPVLRTTIDTPFLSLLGTDEMDIQVFTKGAVASSNVQGTKDLEVSLMLDVSGSMNETTSSGSRKIDDMKLAAKDFLDIIMPNDAAADNRRVGLVPFSDRVNIGAYAPSATGFDPTIQVQTGTTYKKIFSTDPDAYTWYSLSNCRSQVKKVAAYSSYSNTQAENHCKNNFTTRVNNKTTEYKTPDVVNDAGTPVYGTRYLRTCVTERQGSERYTDVVAASGKYVGVYSPGSSLTTQYTTSATNNCSIPEIKTLTTDKQSLKDHIDTFAPLNGTAGHTGTAWSFYMLSPEWNRFWSAGNIDVAEYNDTNTIKAAVIMTDGEYNSTWSSTTAIDQAKALCTSMKAKGITVYTIGFDMSTNVDDPARQTLVACASPNKYYFPYDGNALKTAFNEIGNSLVTIVTKASVDKTVLIQE
jgi:Flp pilus assembly protein TadG